MLTREEKGTKVFDVLAASTRVDMHGLVAQTRMSRAQVREGIAWLRDTLGDEALVVERNLYELATDSRSVRAYRLRRLSYVASSLRRLRKVIEAGGVKFGVDPDVAVAGQMIDVSIAALERATQ